ncbi:hypothetical protein BZA77DRAFT_312436 [Pyronema omphalodes]|nr:hypothetical protein BZA77DRAFT_312436 [Pyronema omphalodes]
MYESWLFFARAASFVLLLLRVTSPYFGHRRRSTTQKNAVRSKTKLCEMADMTCRLQIISAIFIQRQVAFYHPCDRILKKDPQLTYGGVVGGVYLDWVGLAGAAGRLICIVVNQKTFSRFLLIANGANGVQIYRRCHRKKIIPMSIRILLYHTSLNIITGITRWPKLPSIPPPAALISATNLQ